MKHVVGLWILGSSPGEQPESPRSRSSRWRSEKEAWCSLWPWHLHLPRLQDGEGGLVLTSCCAFRDMFGTVHIRRSASPGFRLWRQCYFRLLGPYRAPADAPPWQGDWLSMAELTVTLCYVYLLCSLMFSYLLSLVHSYSL